MSGLVETEIDFEMAMSGEVFVSVRPPYAEVTEMLADRLVYPERIEQFAADQSESLFNSPETVVDLIASALVRDTNGEVTAAARHCRGSTLRHSTTKR